MKGIVLETKNEYAAVLKEDGTVVKIRRKCEVGETVEVPSDRSRVIRFARIAAIVAAAVLIVLGAGGYYFTATAASTVTIYSDEGEVTLSLNRLDRVIRVEASGDVREDDVKAIKNSTLPEALEKVSEILEPESKETNTFSIDIKTGNNDKYETMKSQAVEKGFRISNVAPVNEGAMNSAPAEPNVNDNNLPGGDLPKEQAPSEQTLNSQTPQEPDQPQATEQFREEPQQAPEQNSQAPEQMREGAQAPEQIQAAPADDASSRGGEMPAEGDGEPAASSGDMAPAGESPGAMGGGGPR